MSGGPTHQSILIVDVEGSSGRTDPQKVALRGVLYRTLMAAFARSGLLWDSCRYEDRGDGVYFLIPPVVPKARLAGTFVRALDGLLGEGGPATGGAATGGAATGGAATGGAATGGAAD